MLRLINNTPFETTITLHGNIRLLKSPNDIHCVIDSAPAYRKWCTEWLHILKNGPLYKQVDFCIDPWTVYECIFKSESATNLTMGFNDVRTQWTRHTPGIYQWNTKFNEVTITCVPGKPVVQKQRRGPSVYGDLPLYIKTESENTSWRTVENPITTVQYSPTFNVNYYKARAR